MRVSFFGIITFNAPYLPWTLIGFTILLHNQIPWADMLGFVVGHLYYYLTDVYPRLFHKRPLETPRWLSSMIDTEAIEEVADLQMEIHE